MYYKGLLKTIINKVNWKIGFRKKVFEQVLEAVSDSFFKKESLRSLAPGSLSQFPGEDEVPKIGSCGF
jgi:hypothetical protein